MRAPGHCTPVGRVFLLCSLCALPLDAFASCYRSEFLKIFSLSRLICSAFLHDATGQTLFKEKIT